MNTRTDLLHQWLRNDCGFEAYDLHPVTGGASFRRYFRLIFKHESRIIMDAPPEQEPILDFVCVQKAFAQLGLRVPGLYFQNIDQGFLVLEDFGNQHLFDVLNDANADALVTKALNIILTIQRCNNVPGWTLPKLDYEFMLSELHAFKEWYLIQHMHCRFSKTEEAALDTVFQHIANNCAAQSQVCIHRDFHSQNLMLLKNNEIGILDFQSVMMGPITYDLVSFIKDCYRPWPSDKALKWVVAFHRQLLQNGADVPKQVEDFIKQVAFMAVQRHLKAILTYARKYHRDQDGSYLQFIPIALNYIKEFANRYPALSPLIGLIPVNKEVKG